MNFTAYTIRQSIIRSSNALRRTSFVPKTFAKDIGAASRKHQTSTAYYVYNPEYSRILARGEYLNNCVVEDPYVECQENEKFTEVISSDENLSDLGAQAKKKRDVIDS